MDSVGQAVILSESILAVRFNSPSGRNAQKIRMFSLSGFRIRKRDAVSPWQTTYMPETLYLILAVYLRLGSLNNH